MSYLNTSSTRNILEYTLPTNQISSLRSLSEMSDSLVFILRTLSVYLEHQINLTKIAYYHFEQGCYIHIGPVTIYNNCLEGTYI